jgi:hypothetical protein
VGRRDLPIAVKTLIVSERIGCKEETIMRKAKTKRAAPRVAGRATTKAARTKTATKRGTRKKAD